MEGKHVQTSPSSSLNNFSFIVYVFYEHLSVYHITSLCYNEVKVTSNIYNGFPNLVDF